MTNGWWSHYWEFFSPPFFCYSILTLSVSGYCPSFFGLIIGGLLVKKSKMLKFHATTFYVLWCSAAFSLPDEFVPITLCSWPILTRVLAFVRLIPISWITFSRVTSSFIWFCSNSTTSDEKLASSQRSFVLPCIKLVNLWYIGKSLDSNSFIRSRNMHA